jgi:hypothetical protein
VLVAGYAATDPRVLAALDGLPVIVIGSWGITEPPAGVFVLSAAEIDTGRMDVSAAARLPAPLDGGEVLALRQFPLLRAALDGVTVVSSASPADDAFSQRLMASAPFVEPPGLLSMLAYDAAGMLAGVIRAAPDRTAVMTALEAITYDGLNGTISFADGFWLDAPIHRYAYDAGGALIPVD